MMGAGSGPVPGFVTSFSPQGPGAAESTRRDLVDDVLRRGPLFAGLRDREAAGRLASMTEATLARGDSLFHEGDPGDRLYVVTEGKVKLHRTSADGRENMLAVLGPAEMIGELSLSAPGPRTATATALTEVKLLGLGHGDLQPWMNARPEVEQLDL